MIKDPPLLTIRREFERPGTTDVAALEGVPTGFLVDAMGGSGALDPRMRPLTDTGELPMAFCGPALTCYCGPADNLALGAAIAEAKAGDVIVAATDAFDRAAVVGDLLLGMARNRGVRAFITDGLVRDFDGIVKVGLPVHCAGLTPNSPARNGPGTVGLPVTLGGLTVASGDVVAGDRDGVVVVPKDRISEVLAELPAIRDAEADLDSQVEAGLDAPGFMAALLASDKVRFVE